MRRVKNPRFWKVLNIFLLVVLVSLIAWAQFGKVDVIDNGSWTITPTKSSYRVGEEVTATSNYTKLKEVSGTAKRFFDCDNGSGGYVRYPVPANQGGQATADRQPGTNATGIFITIPDVKPVPTKCRVVITIRYELPLWRNHTETGSSELFDVLPAEQPETNTTQTPAANIKSPASSKSTGANNQQAPSVTNNTTSNTVVQTEPTNQQPEREQQSVVGQLLDTVNGLVNRIL